jgi:hypothetical protein
MRLLVLTIVAATVTLVSCSVVSKNKAAAPQQTQLEIREYQTRQFDTNDVKLIMKAVLNVLQDDGFIVKNAVVDLGLLSASKEINLNDNSSSKSGSGEVWSKILLAIIDNKSNNSNSAEEKTFNKMKIIDASINVTEYGRVCKVRANFQARVIDNRGNPVDAFAIDDPKFYQEFFMKVDKGIFLQKQGL